MKNFTSLLVVIGFMAPVASAWADGCFLCEGGGYVKYKGDDTFPKRKEAQEKYGCKVSGTTSSCNNEKGTVGFLEIQSKELHAKK